MLKQSVPDIHGRTYRRYIPREGITPTELRPVEMLDNVTALLFIRKLRYTGKQLG
ncbi:hypothetical protein [Teredinibacter haidensis]|uniref:hypothetical protein n=1 Tax=Teredinibacter haidensis TaxID=2731755 RepID=UPI000A4605DF|nr:hypothetical protein [Teredinibacter haidensis]